MTQEKRWDVLGIGCATVDDLLFVAEFPRPDFKTRVDHAERQGGGLCAVALVAAARAGASCAYGAQLGHDPYSNFVAETLTREGVDLAPVTWHDGAAPFHSTIIIDTTHNTRNVFFQKLGEVGPAPGTPSEEHIRSARVLHMDHYGGAANVRAVELARHHGVPIVADIERDNVPDFEAFFPQIDHLIVSQGFASRHTGETDPRAMLPALWNDRRSVVGITLGEAGSLFQDAHGVYHIPAVPVDVVDSTGCGDVFHGVYAAALAHGLDLPSRVRMASVAAALKAKCRGAMNGAPHRAAIEAAMKDLPL